MKVPAPPPDIGELMQGIPQERLAEVILASRQDGAGDYLPWDKVRHKTPPDGLSVEEWWFSTRMARLGSRRELTSLRAKDGTLFTYNLPDALLKLTDEITRSASGSITISEAVTNKSTRDRYIVNSLIEEAITSSQLEGASTSHHVAKEMLRSGRQPRDHSERMIVNNYLAMRSIVDFQDEPMTPERICEIHRIVTDGTLDDPEQAGKVQSDDSLRIAVWGENAQLLHKPPPVGELGDRMQRLCDFANGAADEGVYMPPVLRAIAVHFMVGYDHYFVDGNGRTARALFYWAMLRYDYWLTEFLTISTILKTAPAQYGRSFLLTEQDDGDLTHFFLYHCQVITRAIDALHAYLARKAQEVRSLQERVNFTGFNHRQIAVLDLAIKNPGAEYTARSHASAHQVTEQTARTDLQALEKKGLLTHNTNRRQLVWRAHPDLSERLTTPK